MIEAETELRDVVTAQLRPVSYKWLARKLDVSSNDAKSAMASFASAHRDKVDSLWLVAGWTKAAPRAYSFRVVPESGRAAARDALCEVTSEHVYSVQPRGAGNCAHEAWSEEHQQSLDLFAEPASNAFHENTGSGVRSAQVRWEEAGAGAGAAAGGTRNNTLKVDAAKPGSFSAKSRQGATAGTLKAAGFVPSGLGDTKKVSTERAAAAAHREMGMGVKPPGAVQREVKARANAGMGAKGADASAEQQRMPAKATPTSALKKPENKPTALSSKARMASMFANAPAAAPAADEEGAKGGREPMDHAGMSSDEDDDDDEEMLSLSRRKSRLRRKPARHGNLLDDDALEAAHAEDVDEGVAGRNAEAMKEEDDAFDERGEASGGRADDGAASCGVAAADAGAEMVSDDTDVDGSKENDDGGGVRTRTKRRKVERTTINDRGEEVTEVVWEEYEVEVAGTAADNAKGGHNRAQPQESTRPAPSRPETKLAKPSKPKAPKPAKAGGAGRSIMSFFSKAT